MATIYIDPTVAGTGTGTFLDPYRSWASVTFAAGNSYLQKAGTTFVGTVTVNVGGTSEAARVVLGAYDAATGEQTTTQRAIVNANGNQNGITTSGQRHFVTISAFEVYGARHGSFAAGIVSSINNGTDFVVEYCLVYDISNSPAATGSAGIKWFSDGAKIRHNTVYDIGDDGMYGEGDNVEVAYNDVSRVSQNTTGGDCLQMANSLISTSLPWVHHNTFDHSDVDCKQCFIITSSGAGGASTGGIIEDNVVIGYENSANNHKAIYAGSAGMIIRRNTVSGGEWGIGLDTNSAGTAVYGNLITNSSARSGVYGVIFAEANSAVYNNTVINTSEEATNATYGIYQSANVSGTSIRNNVVQGWKYGVRVNVGAPATETNNSYYRNATNKIDSSLASPAIGAGGVTSDPLLDANYRPLVGSPLIGAGTFLGGQDLYGREFHNPPTIGAVQYHAARIATTRSTGTRSSATRDTEERSTTGA